MHSTHHVPALPGHPTHCACTQPHPPQGYGDPERDYQLLAQQAADEAEAAADGQPLGGSAAKRAKLGTAAVAQVRRAPGANTALMSAGQCTQSGC